MNALCGVESLLKMKFPALSVTEAMLLYDSVYEFVSLASIQKAGVRSIPGLQGSDVPSPPDRKPALNDPVADPIILPTQMKPSVPLHSLDQSAEKQ